MPSRRRNPNAWRPGRRLPGEQLAALVAAFVESTQAHSVVSPDVYTLRRDALNGTLDAASLRATYLPAVLLSQAIAGAIGYSVKSWWPLGVAGLTSLTMIAGYERLLPPEVRLNHPLEALFASLQDAGSPWSLLSAPAAPALPGSAMGDTGMSSVTDAQFIPRTGGF